MKAVNFKKTSNYEVAKVGELYNLIQLGAKIDIESLDNMTAQMLLAYATEVNYKMERDARLNR